LIDTDIIHPESDILILLSQPMQGGAQIFSDG
jgi:hypothetical protein